MTPVLTEQPHLNLPLNNLPHLPPVAADADPADLPPAAADVDIPLPPNPPHPEETER